MSNKFATPKTVEPKTKTGVTSTFGADSQAKPATDDRAVVLMRPWILISPTGTGIDTWRVEDAPAELWYLIGLVIIVDPDSTIHAQGLYFTHLDSVIAQVVKEQ